MATTAQRVHVQGVLAFLYKYRAQLDYPPNDVRGSADARQWGLTEGAAEKVLEGGGRMEFDCSQCAAWVWRCAGLWPWSQPGWTGSDLALTQFPHYTNPKDALAGAGVVFGVPPGHHMALVWEPDTHGGNPVLGSHGEPGFDRITLQDEAARQASLGAHGVTFLSIAHL
jgi:hypothetical protein